MKAPKELTTKIKKSIARQIDAVTKVTVSHVKFNGLYELPCGAWFFEYATAKVSYIDYRFGDDGLESYRESYSIVFDGIKVTK